VLVQPGFQLTKPQSHFTLIGHENILTPKCFYCYTYFLTDA